MHSPAVSLLLPLPPPPPPFAAEPPPCRCHASLHLRLSFEKYEREGARYWDLFYRRHETRFFRDRHWTDREFPQLLTARTLLEVRPAAVDCYQRRRARWLLPPLQSQPLSPAPYLCTPSPQQVGCGVGNTTFPLLGLNSAAHIYACDFAPTAVALVQQDPRYAASGRMVAFVADITGGRGGRRGCGCWEAGGRIMRAALHSAHLKYLTCRPGACPQLTT